MPERLTRLSDEVYARFDGHRVRLTTPPFQQEIALDPEVVGKLVDYIAGLRARAPDRPLPAWEILVETITDARSRNEIEVDATDANVRC